MKKQFFITISLVLLILTPIYPSEPEWVTLPDMPRERFGHCAVVYRDKVWIIGGKNQKGNSIKTIDCYDLIKNEWLADASELLQARYNATAAVYDDKIFVMGGYDERQILNLVEYYDPNDNEWKELAPLFTQREGANAVVFHDTLFVIGGRSDTGILPKILDSIEFWDSSAQRWQEHPTWRLEHARVLMQSVVVDNYIYTLGGQFIDSELNFVERFGLNSEPESRSPLNIPRFYFSAVKIESLIYVIGGVRSGEFEAITDTIEYYASNHDRWYTLDAYMKRPRAGLSAVSYHNNIYVFGGMDINLKIWNTAEVLTGVPLTVDTNTTVVNRNKITEHPAKHNLIKNYPNPFNSSTTITFELAQDENQVQLIIFNMLGGKVRTFLLNSFSPGVHQIEWDGCDDQGRILESGIYLAQLRSDRGYGEVLKLSFIK